MAFLSKLSSYGIGSSVTIERPLAGAFLFDAQKL